VRFIWRLHPQMTMEGLVDRIPGIRIRPSNIQVSSASLDDDLSGCRWALYRGTTAIIRAVGMQCQPLYLAQPGEMSIDPLHGLREWRQSVMSVSDFVTQTSAPFDARAAADAVEYCRSIFSPVDINPLRQLLMRRGH